MYMPECLGTELAKVIRQHERHVSVPIIYLSAEDDLDKQLDAMSEGGDDFLTKPIRPRHLIATVRTRASRARSLKAPDGARQPDRPVTTTPIPCNCSRTPACARVAMAVR